MEVEVSDADAPAQMVSKPEECPFVLPLQQASAHLLHVFQQRNILDLKCVVDVVDGAD